MKTLLGLVSNLTQQIGNLTRHQQQQEELLLRVQQPAVPVEPTVRVVVDPDEPAQAAPAEPAGSDAAPILPEVARPFQPRKCVISSYHNRPPTAPPRVYCGKLSLPLQIFI